MNTSLFFEPELDLERLRTVLETSGFWARRNATRHLATKQMAALFEAAEPCTLDYLCPTTEPLVEVIQHGRNTLPAFNNFQKRFCRPDGDGEGDVLWGYNHNDPMPGVLTGPGYFVARIDDKGECLIDYGKLPPRKPASWPKIIPNEARIGRFVWVGMTDVVRKVSDTVSVGRAFRGGKAMDAWFMLCRQDPTS